MNFDLLSGYNDSDNEIGSSKTNNNELQIEQRYHSKLKGAKEPALN